MLRKTCTLADFKMLDDGPGGFQGYGSTFGNLDLAGEIVVKGAFAKSLDRFKAEGFIAVGHDWNSLPVGTIADVHEDDKGLFLRSDFHTSDEAQKARAWVRERHERGKSVGLSIGYAVKASEPSKAGLLLKELDLFEVSLVTVPCNPLAQATGVKSVEPGDVPATLPELRAYLDDLIGKTLYPLLFEGNSGQEDRFTQVDAALAGLPATLGASLRAVLSGADEGELATEFKDVFAVPARAAGSYKEQLSSVRATVEGLITRGHEISAVRQKEGRLLSPTSVDEWRAVQGAIAALIKEATPRPSIDDLYFELKDRNRKRLLGTAVGE